MKISMSSVGLLPNKTGQNMLISMYECREPEARGIYRWRKSCVSILLTHTQLNVGSRKDKPLMQVKQQ